MTRCACWRPSRRGAHGVVATGDCSPASAGTGRATGPSRVIATDLSPPAGSVVAWRRSCGMAGRCARHSLPAGRRRRARGGLTSLEGRVAEAAFFAAHPAEGFKRWDGTEPREALPPDPAPRTKRRRACRYRTTVSPIQTCPVTGRPGPPADLQLAPGGRFMLRGTYYPARPRRHPGAGRGPVRGLRRRGRTTPDAATSHYPALPRTIEPAGPWTPACAGVTYLEARLLYPPPRPAPPRLDSAPHASKAQRRPPTGGPALRAAPSEARSAEGGLQG